MNTITTQASDPSVQPAAPAHAYPETRAYYDEFAAAYERSEGKPVKTAETSHRQKTSINYSDPKPLSRIAEFPHDNLGIH